MTTTNPLQTAQSLHLLRGGPVDAELAEVDRLVSARATEVAALSRLRSEHAAARRSDAEALATALATGKADPGDKHQAAAAKEIEASQRRIAAYDIAVTRAHEALLDAVRAHGTAWAGRLADDQLHARERITAAARELGDAVASVAATAQRQHLVEVLASGESPTTKDFAGAPKPVVVPRSTVLLTEGSKAVIDLPQLLAALADYVEPFAPPSPATFQANERPRRSSVRLGR